jgi:hypothetical protein
MLKKLTVALLCGALGTGASVTVAACGEDRGSVEIEGGTTGTGKTTGATTGSETTTESETGTSGQ